MKLFPNSQLAPILTIKLCTALLLMPFSGQTNASDLLEIYEMALANDPVYQARWHQHQANSYDVAIAETTFSPSVDASGQLGKDYSDSSDSWETGDDNNINLNVNLPLFNKTDRISINQSEKRQEISAIQLQQAKQNLILRVADRYFNLLAGVDALDVTRVEKIAIQRQMDLADERLEVGLGTRTDLYDAQARFKAAEANELKAQNKINNDIALLKQIIGITPEPLSPLSESAPLEFPSPNAVGSWIDRSLTDNLELKVQTYTKDIALDEIDKQKTLKSPVVSVDGNYRWIDSSSSFNNSSSSFNTASVALQVRIPLYLGGSTQLKSEQAGHQYNESESRLEEARRSASAQATSAFLDVSSGVSQVEALFDAIRAGESALEAKEEGFNAGLTTNLDVLDAQRDLSQTRTDYLRARYTYILSVLELESAIGNLDEEDIERVNAWLGE